MASRWSSPLVEPPVAATPAIALRSARRSRNARAPAPPPRRARPRAARPAPRPPAFSSRASAGISPSPRIARPRQSSAIAIVLAVNWPAQVPGPGHAWRSSSSSSARVDAPALVRADRLPHVLDRHARGRAAARRASGRCRGRPRACPRGPAPSAPPASSCRSPTRQTSASKSCACDHQLDRVGDHLARDERRAHARRRLRLVVGDRDGVELERHAARRRDRLARPARRARAA